MGQNNRYQEAKRITSFGAYVNCALGILKVIFGVFGNSQALLADGIHSFSDVLTDLMVLFAAKAGSNGPDEDHPYGHARIETFAALALAIVLVLVGVGIVAEALWTIVYHQDIARPDMLVIIIALVSTGTNEYLYRFTMKVGNKINSDLLRTNAWHNRVDAMSSFIVLVGVIAARFGLVVLDRVAALVVGVFIIKMGVQMAWRSIKELIDTGLPVEQSHKLLDEIKAVSGVAAVHQLRTRSLGGAVFTDVHVQVNPRLTVSEGHYIADKVYKRLRQDGDVSDALVHIDPEDDEQGSLSENLPSRREVEQLLAKHWQHLAGYTEIKRLNLHYLSGKLFLEVFLSLELLNELSKVDNLLQEYREIVKEVSYIAQVDLFFSRA